MGKGEYLDNYLLAHYTSSAFVAYTGTTGNFTTFDSKYSRTASKGFFFTVDKNVASSEGEVKEIFLT